MKVYLLRFSGIWLAGELITIAETKRKAFNQAVKRLKINKLWDENKDLTIDDLEEIDLSVRHTIMIDNGDY